MYYRLQNKAEQESILVSYMKNNLINNCAILLKFSNIMSYKQKIERLAEMLKCLFYYYFYCITNDKYIAVQD